MIKGAKVSLLLGFMLMVFTPMVIAVQAADKTAADFLVEVGIMHYEKGEDSNAIHELSKALILNPNHQKAKKYLRKMGVGEGIYSPQPVSVDSDALRASTVDLTRKTSVWNDYDIQDEEIQAKKEMRNFLRQHPEMDPNFKQKKSDIVWKKNNHLEVYEQMLQTLETEKYDLEEKFESLKLGFDELMQSNLLKESKIRELENRLANPSKTYEIIVENELNNCVEDGKSFKTCPVPWIDNEEQALLKESKRSIKKAVKKTKKQESKKWLAKLEEERAAHEKELKKAYEAYDSKIYEHLTSIKMAQKSFSTVSKAPSFRESIDASDYLSNLKHYEEKLHVLTGERDQAYSRLKMISSKRGDFFQEVEDYLYIKQNELEILKDREIMKDVKMSHYQSQALDQLDQLVVLNNEVSDYYMWVLDRDAVVKKSKDDVENLLEELKNVKAAMVEKENQLIDQEKQIFLLEGK